LIGMFAPLVSAPIAGIREGLVAVVAGEEPRLRVGSHMAHQVAPARAFFCTQGTPEQRGVHLRNLHHHLPTHGGGKQQKKCVELFLYTQTDF
jgi:hypothetical protein